MRMANILQLADRYSHQKRLKPIYQMDRLQSISHHKSFREVIIFRRKEYVDPFMYLVKVSNGQTEFTHRLYTENGSFNIPQNMSGEVTVQYRQSVCMMMSKRLSG